MNINKENILFGTVGLLLGLIIGFMFTNSVNQQAMATGNTGGGAKQMSNLPAGHPEIQNNSQNALSMPETQAVIDKAKQNPEDFEAQIKAAELFYQIGRYDGAIEHLKQANKLKPDDYETIVNLGNVLFDSGAYEDAEKWYNDALAKKADDVNVRTDLGLTFMFRTPPDTDRAIKEFLKSLETDPNHVQTLQNLTVAYTKKSDAAKAKQTLLRLEGVDAKNSAISKLRDEINKLETKSETK